MVTSLDKINSFSTTNANGGCKNRDLLSNLVQVLKDGVNIVEQEQKKRNVESLFIDEERIHPTDDMDVDKLPTVIEREARDQILSACSLLSALVDHPVSRLAKISSAYLDVAALDFAADNKIPDILETSPARREKDGAVHVDQIAKEIDADANRTARILRYLSAIHVFKETEEGWFANNRYSVHFKNGSPLQAVFAMGVHDVAVTSLKLNDFMQSAAGKLADPTGQLPLNLAFNYEKSMFSWMNEPFNEPRRERFNGVMVMKNADSYGVIADLPWNAMVSHGGILVDIGGGVGSLAYAVQGFRPDIKVVVQDQEGMIHQAKSFWQEKNPEAIENGMALFQPHDFFQPNPIHEADLYVFRAIFHNWNDAKVSEILKATVSSMGPKSRILVIDALLNPVLTSTTNEYGLPSSSFNELRSDSQQDLTMMHLFPSLERTRREWDQVLATAGLKIQTVFKTRSRKGCFEVTKV